VRVRNVLFLYKSKILEEIKLPNLIFKDISRESSIRDLGCFIWHEFVFIQLHNALLTRPGFTNELRPQ
jgi:hypothetical protein